jgi:hypothetical protein
MEISYSLYAIISWPLRRIDDDIHVAACKRRFSVLRAGARKTPFSPRPDMNLDRTWKCGSAYAVQIALENKVNDQGKDRVNESGQI